MICAAIDCGTNSTRLLIVENGHEIRRELRMTRLGYGVDATNRLGLRAIERTLAALQEFEAICSAAGVDAARAVATSAARDASNSDDLLCNAKSILGFPLEVLSGIEEGCLTYAGATADMDSDAPVIIDIGGGSTELVTLDDGTDVIVSSLDAGCVRMTERHLHGDPYSVAELERLYTECELAIDTVDSRIRAVGSERQLVAVAGTATTLAGLDLGLVEYHPGVTHGHVLRREAVERLLHGLAGLKQADRAGEPLLLPGRADVIVAGAAILSKAMESFDWSEAIVSEKDILDGIAQKLGATYDFYG